MKYILVLLMFICLGCKNPIKSTHPNENAERYGCIECHITEED